ncbi:MAG: CoA-transferase [Thermodesulfobacteriota bacterium]
MNSKLMPLPEAVSRFIKPGLSLVLGAALEACIPFAVGHEIIRQRIRNLTLIGPISDVLFDMLIGGGAVGRIMAAWVGNVSTGLGYNFKRAVEQGRPCPLEVRDHSNLSIATALDAGGMGLPFGLTRSLFGTDIQSRNQDLEPISCPFTGQALLAVRALNPDLAVIHAQRADRDGNTHLWGNLGIVPEAVRASRQVIVTVEEIVPGEVIRSDPNRTLIPGFKVAAVIELPWGAHPSPVQGYYGHDDDFYVDYARQTKDPAEAEAWFEAWVYSRPDHAAYLERLGRKRLDKLRVSRPAPAATVDYGY